MKPESTAALIRAHLNLRNYTIVDRSGQPLEGDREASACGELARILNFVGTTEVAFDDLFDADEVTREVPAHVLAHLQAVSAAPVYLPDNVT